MKLPARFWANVNVSTACWLWKGCKNRDGYGAFWLDGKMCLAHRVIVGDPPGVQVRHKCLRRACVNPDHLRYVTVTPASARRPNRRKLTQILAQRIRRRHETSFVTQRALAEEYGVSPSTIHHVLKWNTWRDA